MPSLPAGLDLAQARALCAGFVADNDIILHAFNQPFTSIRSGPVAPLMDQQRRYVRYQVMMNRSYFEHVRNNEYFKAETQGKAVHQSERAHADNQSKAPRGAFVSLPFDRDGTPGMVEVKSAWRVLDGEYDDPRRFYSRPGFILAAHRKTCVRAPIGLGLVALHVHRMTQLSHVASTFEQVDNVEVLDRTTSPTLVPSFNPGNSNDSQSNLWPPYGNRGFDGRLPPLITATSVLPPRWRRQPVNISRATPITHKVDSVNQHYQKRYGDSPMRYYQLVGVQHLKSRCRMRDTGDFSNPVQWKPASCPRPNTDVLINTALESYTQLVNPFTSQPYNYSCQGCHAHARPCGFTHAAPAPGALPEFKVMSYLLSKALFQDASVAADGYSCNDPRYADAPR